MPKTQVLFIRVLMVLFLTVPDTFGCSWDYLIWMTRDKSADPLYRFVRNGKAGFIDQTGKVVIEPIFEATGNYGQEFNHGLMAIGEGDYVDRTGKVVLETGFYRSWGFSEGLAFAMQKDGERWGQIPDTLS